MSKFNPELPFNELPFLPPKKDLETPKILKACIEANKALAKLKIAEKLIPNQTVLINSIPLLESQASSAIENIVTTTDELFEHSSAEDLPMSPAVKETLQYRKALYQGYQVIKNRPINLRLAIDICSSIRQVEMEVRKLPGTALVNDLTGEKIYTPPEGIKLLVELLGNWETFLHADDGIDPLIKLAVQHYQFEAIHPFFDGNGRTGRILNLLFLVDQGLLDTPILYLSGYIIRNKSDYYKRLLEVTTKGAFEEWVLFMLEAILVTSKYTLSKIFKIEELIQRTVEVVKNKSPGVYRRELIELIFNQPYIRIQNLMERDNIGRDTASKHLKTLVEIGVLREQKKGREKVFVNESFLSLLEKG
ncbi:MAG: Fic family protein [Chlamydiia bacterium]|nr:Fic family protein [Chlamydiia bacterium]